MAVALSPSNATIHITIDFDGITGFPAHPKWLCEDGISIKELAEKIRSIGKRIRLFDIGGIHREIPDFELVDVAEFVPTPQMCRGVIECTAEKEINVTEETPLQADGVCLQLFGAPEQWMSRTEHSSRACS